MERREFLSLGTERGSPLTREDLVAALRPQGPDQRRSDAATAAQIGKEQGDPVQLAAPPRTLVPAAVLVPLVCHSDGLTVLLTQRTQHLIHHGGQISFPGGRREAGDVSEQAAALRESQEEIGLDPRLVDVIGRLDEYVTITGFQVTPVVGLITPPLTLAPDPFEVAEIFEVPLAFIMDPGNRQRHSRVTPEGQRRWYYALPYQDHYIWGATAAMLINLSERLAKLWIS